MLFSSMLNQVTDRSNIKKKGNSIWGAGCSSGLYSPDKLAAGETCG